MDGCNWSMILTIIGTNIALVALIGGFILWVFTKLDGDIKSLDGKIQSLANKLEDDSRAHTQRADQLYNILINLLKEQIPPKTNP